MSPGSQTTAAVPPPRDDVLVSILMPMRNPGRFLVPAIRSVLDQSHRSLELIVVDDGSTDGSREAVEALADARIRLFDGPRAGISACLNAGLAQVAGQLVMRCDADDLYPGGRIAAQVDWLARHPECVAVCGSFSMIAPDDETLASLLRNKTHEDLDAAQAILDGRLKTHFCTFALRREALARVGAFRAFFETAEDIDFTLRLAEAGAIGFLPQDAYLYRLHGTSITHTQASVRRRFFEAAAYEMSRDRQSCGTDALMRGDPPTVPADDGSGRHADGAELHMARMLVGESWAAFRRGDRAGARKAAVRALGVRPAHRDAWRALLLVSLRALPRR